MRESIRVVHMPTVCSYYRRKAALKSLSDKTDLNDRHVLELLLT